MHLPAAHTSTVALEVGQIVRWMGWMDGEEVVAAVAVGLRCTVHSLDCYDGRFMAL